MYHYDIGEMVRPSEIENMNKFINDYGVKAFNSAVYHGAFSEVISAYLHPCSKMRTTEGFETIFQAMVNAYA